MEIETDTALSGSPVRTTSGRGSERPERSGTLARARLDALLERFEESGRRVLTVWAPAGAGKSVLLAQWARALQDRGQTLAWTDAAALGSAVAAPRTDWLVLDDVHTVTPGAGGDALAELIAATPRGTRIIAAGRFEPTGFAAAVEDAGGRFDTPSADLAFTLEETLAFALGCGLVLPIADAESLTARTGGWAAGLALAMPYLLTQGNASAAIEHFGGDQHQVADYLVVRVLDALSEDDRDVLMSSAVSTEVPLSLAVSLTGRCDVGLVLQRLSRQNLLIDVDATADRIRFHPILTSYLRAEARRRDADRAAANHAAAGRWYAGRDAHEPALDQALLSRLPGAISEQLLRSGLPLLLEGRAARVVTALRSLPESDDTAGVTTLRLAVDAPDFPDRIGAEARMARLTDMLSAAEPVERRRWRPIAAAIRAFLTTEVAEAVARLAELRAIASTRHDLALDTALVLRAGMAWCLMVTGDRPSADALLRSVQSTALRAGYTWVHLVASDAAANLAVRDGDWRTANAYEARIADVGFDTTPPFSRATARAVLTRTAAAYERCEPVSFTALHRIEAADPDGSALGLGFQVRVVLAIAALDSAPAARSHLAQLTQLVRLDGAAHPRAVAALAPRLHAATLGLHGGAAAAEVRRLISSILGPEALETKTLRLLAAGSSDHAAERAVAESVDEDRGAWNGTSVVNASLALAGHAHEHGRPLEAAQRVRRALDVSEQYGYAREFLACGGSGARLVRQYRNDAGPLTPYADEVLALADQAHVGRDDDSDATRIALTPKEQELLLELPAHQTVGEIAAKHHLSSNTIKTHLRSIYAKLSASGRTEAVSNARRRGLL
jgi:LuxR family maltose regulon positive regulatory protein